MLVQWPIRVKLLVGLALLVVVVGILAGSGLYTTYAYRGLVKSLSARVSELPLAAELAQHVSDLRVTLGEIQGLQGLQDLNVRGLLESRRARLSSRPWMVRDQFCGQLDEVESTLVRYRRQIEHKLDNDLQIADNEAERETVRKIEAALARVRQANLDQDWMFDEARVHRLDVELASLQSLTGELPSHLHRRLAGFADDVRGEYRALIVGTWIASLSAALVFALFVRLFFHWVISPLRTLITGSRRMASGEFNYRIQLETRDEMSELAAALNDMTARFQAIRDDLDRQVQERTKQVVRSEQLASVGYLAAGVAHEINNPLASIAISAESLEGRLRELLAETDVAAPHADQLAVVFSYLRMIQDEAFRCKGITEKLLDFARVGPVHRQNTELGELVHGVIEMIGHVGKHHGKQIVFTCPTPVYAFVNPQEIKQVVLNLLTNALDSLDAEGTVRVELAAREGMAELCVADNGCGMDQTTLKHIFEPFFTRRRSGQGAGTGLGLSISYRIVADHGGEIEGESPGPGHGSTFRVRLPLAEQQSQSHLRHRAA